MKTLLVWSLLAVACAPATRSDSLATRPELQYLEAVNRAGPPRDPQLLFLLMGQFANANRPGDGVEFFTARLREAGPALGGTQRALYLAAIGLLRARQSSEIFLPRRIGWVKDTVATLEEAKRLSGGDIFVIRWIAGVVYAQLPGFFGQRSAARADLAWCLEHAARAPNPGWLREVHYQLGALARASGDQGQAARELAASGYTNFDKAITLTTPFSEDSAAGHTFSARSLVEVVPGKVYALSGYEFTEYYFVVSQDGRELIAIDAGTRPDAAEGAYRALRAHAPGLPPLSRVLITHSHWDHIGGHRFFRGLQPAPRFYASAHYREELAKAEGAPTKFGRQFFGDRYRPEDIRGFTPDVAIDAETGLDVGGTHIDVIPVQGGETSDALLFDIPSYGVMFVGDVAMPYLGAPFVEEGSVEGLLQSIDVIVQRHSGRLLHGHEPLTRTFGAPGTLARLRPHLVWLREQVLEAIRGGQSRAELQQANLIAPGLLADPSSQLAYLLMRENVINRLYDQHLGYWQPDLEGMAALSETDRGSALVDYLGLSAGQVAAAARRLMADGKHEMAARLVGEARRRLPADGDLAAVERLAYQRLMEKYQDFNPFKFIIYSHRAGD
jgi:glyoxylase-like metal-dependent hydrolase (beta-lactamase superfamily II)